MATNGTTRIEASLTQELSQSGWLASVRAMVVALVRSGECTTYEEVMGRVRGAIRAAGAAEGEKTSSSSKKGGGGAVVVNGLDAKVVPEGVGNIAVPHEVILQGLKLVRAEVEKVCDLKVDDVDG
jgi:hypothetical protein